jgi:hypothetical protein
MRCNVDVRVPATRDGQCRDCNRFRAARLNCIDHLLSQFPFEEVLGPEIKLPDRVFDPNYERSIMPPELYVPSKY